MALTTKQKVFAETYISNGFNALNAYNIAFGGGQKNKPSYPYTLLKKPEIQEYIEQRRQEMYESLNIDSMRVMTEIAKIAFQEENSNTVYAKLKALELLSKNLSLQTQKTENKDVIEVQLMED